MTTQTTKTTRELTPAEAKQYPDAQRNGQVFTVQEDATQLVFGPTGSRTVTTFTTKTADCAVGVLSPTGASPLPHLKNDADILTTLGAGLGALMNGGDLNSATKEMLAPEGELIAPGLRMNGTYGGGSFGLTFHRESVTMVCGDSEQALPYTVQRSANKTMLVIDQKPNPLSWQLLPDGSINGSETVQVNGRVITGTTDDTKNPFVFAPHAARCPVGRLVPGAKITMTNATPVSVAPAAGPAPSTVAGGTSLKITATPSVAPLLANKVLAILKDSLDTILNLAGVMPQGGSSRIVTWGKACERASTDATCQKGLSAFQSFMVARTTLDTNGSATFTNIPSSGTFFVVVDTSYSNHYMWNLRIDLKPGTNSITLTESNTIPIR